jgi:hypothetical protein
MGSPTRSGNDLFYLCSSVPHVAMRPGSITRAAERLSDGNWTIVADPFDRVAPKKHARYAVEVIRDRDALIEKSSND